MIFIYAWMLFIFLLTVSLQIYLCKKYKDVMDMFSYKVNWLIPLGRISLKPLRNNNDDRVKNVYNIILIYKIIYYLGIIIFIILAAVGIL